MPEPLQIFPETAPFEQVVGPQLLPLGARLHVPGLPEHESCSPHGSVASLHAPPGFVPCLAAPQVPLFAGFESSLFAAAQAMHLPVQAVSQHTPSAQLPDWHSLEAPQVCPLFFCGRQALPPQ